MIKYIFLAIFFAASIVHLVHSWQDSSKRKYTKPLLLLSLLFFYVFATGKISWVLVAALATSWLGDVLLMLKGDKWFVMGGISFLISHILFIFVYIPNIVFSSIKWWIAFPIIVYAVISFLIMRSVKENTPKPMFIPMFLYLVANSTMNIFALMQLISVPCLGSALAYVGAILFFASDCTLFIVRYHKKEDLIFKKHFTIMLTYILGEFLITLGMLLIK
ncbi:MAG: lysoplasmalogenase [Clostridia bacterium]|nr:lysoplasmalogenase [Clostridia bacterium]